jgi:multidrug resistance protein MdtO
MEAVAQPVIEAPRPLAWFWGFLKEELAPYPGRGVLVARMVTAATLVMLITMTFQIPFGVQAIYVLVISREDARATVKAAKMAILIFGVADAIVMFGAVFSAADPMMRSLWVVANLFIAFFAISTMADYIKGVGFGITVVLTIPLWDLHLPAERNVESTMWAAGQTMIASVIAALVAVIFAKLRPGDELVVQIAERLGGIEELLNSYAANGPVDEAKARKITRLAMLGTSTLRRMLGRSGYSPQYTEQTGAVVALVGRLVDLAASLANIGIEVPEGARSRIRQLAQNISGIRIALEAGKIPRPNQAPPEGNGFEATPMLREMEKTVSLLAEVFVGTHSISAYPPPRPTSEDPPQRLFVPDALSNPEHFRFALKGCLAASLCYFVFTALDWPGINTSVTTCVLTALTTIGASHQKQFLRFAGALAGGALGLGAQVFILPSLDSVAGFTLLFVLVTFVSAWLATSSPRISYFGIQIANAFYIINLQDFKVATSLEPGRDRIVGILLGLFMMWLVFDQWGSTPAAAAMKRAFISTLRSLAQLAREPLSTRLHAAIERSYSLRETINKSFDQVRALSDGVLFEFGASRQQDLAFRSQITRWQPQLRMLFITRVALLKYRLQLPGFELPQSVRLAQRDFDEHLAAKLEGMAARLQSNSPQKEQDLDASLVHLEESVTSCSRAPGAGTANIQTLLLLSGRVASLAVSLDKEI